MKMKCLLTGLTLMLAVLTMRGAALTDAVTMLKAQADELFNSEQYSKAPSTPPNGPATGG